MIFDVNPSAVRVTGSANAGSTLDLIELQRSRRILNETFLSRVYSDLNFGVLGKTAHHQVVETTLANLNRGRVALRWGKRDQ